MNSNRMIYLVLTAFIAGNMLIIFVQYNSSKNIHSLITGNKKLSNELSVGNQLREAERDLLATEIRLGRTLATDDTTYLVQIDTLLRGAHALLDSLRIMDDEDKTIRNIDQLSKLADEKLMLKNLFMDTYRQGRRISSDSFRAIMHRRSLAIDVNNFSRRFYTSRERLLDSLSVSINSSGRRAQRWSVVMILIVVVSGAVLFWYIISWIRRQNLLIQQLDASEKKVREVSQIKENFMANMSHEIRTPMNAIVGFTNLMKARNRDPELDEFIEAIGQSGESLLTIINDILDISKIEAGMMRIESTFFSVRDLIHSIQTMFAGKMQEKGLDFTTTIDQLVPDTVSGDPTRLMQILVNMIGNAMKFTSEGAIKVLVDNKGRAFARPHGSAGGNHIRLGFVVSDTGIGIAREKLAGIFERFRQAEDSITRNYGGTGLGLAIARDLISLQGGEIDAESEPGKGTIFRFTIPYDIADEAARASAMTESTGTGYVDHRDIRILVVEDNEMNQNLLKHLLTGWRLSFDMVHNGIEALEKLRTRTFDLVLMDIQMPGMDGYTATQEIRTKLKLQTPVLAMTAHAFPGEREKCLSYGMNEYIAKPIKEKELFGLIARLTGIDGNQTDLKKGTISAPDDAYQLIDLQYMREISDGDREYERTVTEQFMEVIPVDLHAMESALGNRDLVTLRRTAHAMRTDVAIMGLLERMEPFLDTLEYETFDEHKFQKAVLSVKTICTAAMPEVHQFYKEGFNNEPLPDIGR
jgi:signal transduction histidine kinase/DNA-binding response OmpR family regulator